ncbi:neuronal acetylcholine receptor subunit alpha-6-like [Haliotis rubra]|uniref:neuronal acetylcholine receptor subunit alpha-6-like n=1 Tax=Haliotis rubra TaxID=36100 RepID=UPI001EE4F210|nr:neuronal acetylcholine receptor subunit alpha-6-like [Haliotis rubra]
MVSMKELFWLCGAAVLFVTVAANPTSKDVQSVLNLLQNKVDRRLRPVSNQSEPVDVTLTFHILTITGFNEVEQKLSCTGWLDISWKDEFMTWNETEYNGTRQVYPPSDSHWLPFLAVVNSFEEMRPLGQNIIITKASSDGIMHWYPADSFITACTVDISKYPYDTQTCEIEFFPWGRSSEDIILKVGEGVLLYNYRKNGEWELKKVDMYPMMKFNGNDYISMVYVTFVIQRRPAFFILNLILPVLLLSLLNVLVFLLPAESGERVSYAITVLLALAVFLSFISDNMPKTAESLSALSVYLTTMFVISAASVAGSILTLVLYHRDRKRPIPTWLTRHISRRQRKTAPISGADGSQKEDCQFPKGKQTTWADVSIYIDKVFFSVCMLVIVPATTSLMVRIFV